MLIKVTKKEFYAVINEIDAVVSSKKDDSFFRLRYDDGIIGKVEDDGISCDGSKYFLRKGVKNDF